MAVMAGPGLVQSQKLLILLCQFRSLGLGPSSSTVSGTVMGSWIGSGASRPQTSVLMGVVLLDTKQCCPSLGLLSRNVGWAGSMIVHVDTA